MPITSGAATVAVLPALLAGLGGLLAIVGKIAAALLAALVTSLRRALTILGEVARTAAMLGLALIIAGIGQDEYSTDVAHISSTGPVIERFRNKSRNFTDLCQHHLIGSDHLVFVNKTTKILAERYWIWS